MSIASLEAELSRQQSINYELRSELNTIASGVNRAYERLENERSKIANALDHSNNMLEQSKSKMAMALETQYEIESLYVRFKAMELANKQIRACNNKKYYEFGNYRTVRKIVQGLMDNLDMNLVSEQIIYKTVEKEHLKTPDYWLTCVLLSVMAWQTDDKYLADRAMAIALQLDKKDSEKFAMEMQNIMSEQAKKLTERENTLSEKEKEIENLKKEMESSKAELKDREEKLKEREEEFEREKEKTEEKIKKIKEEADERVKRYEEQNTKDIMNMQNLAKQISYLQDRLNVAPSSSDADTEDEIARLKAKTRQLTLQKASVEKEMKNVVSERDAKIKRLSDVITEKEQDITALKKEMNTKVSAKVEKETMKSQGYVSELESKLKSIGHIITPDEIFEYYKKNEDEDAGVEEKHAANATIISFKDGELDVAIRIGDMLCSVEVSKNTVVNDKVLRKLNTKFGDIKFFISPTQQQTTARAYFAPNASLDQIDSTLDRVLENFKK